MSYNILLVITKSFYILIINTGTLLNFKKYDICVSCDLSRRRMGVILIYNRYICEWNLNLNFND